MATNLRDANLMMDFTVWIRDVGKIGECPSFQPPDIQVAVEEYRGGGMDGPVEIPYGIEKIEFDFDLHTWDENIWADLGFGPGSLDVPIEFRGYLLTPNGDEKGVLIETYSLIKSIKTAKVEPGKKVDMTISCACRYYKHSVGGTALTEIDMFNKVTIINGFDRSANARALLGITF